MSATPPPADFAFTDSPFALPDEYDSKSASPEPSQQQGSSKRLRVQQQQLPWQQHQPFDDDDLPSPALTSSHSAAAAAWSREERKEDSEAADEQEFEEQNEAIHVGNKRRRPSPLHTPPYQPAVQSVYSPPPELEPGPEAEADTDEEVQPSYTQLSNEVSNEDSSTQHRPQRAPSYASRSPPFPPPSAVRQSAEEAADEPIDLTDEDEVLPTPILPISLTQSSSQQHPQLQLSAPPRSAQSHAASSQPLAQSSGSSVPFYTPHGSWNLAGRGMHPTFSQSPSYPSFPPHPPPPHPQHSSLLSQPSAQQPYSSLPRSHSEHVFPSSSSSYPSPIAPIPYSMVSSSPPAADSAVVDLTDEADIEADLQRLHVPLPSTTPSPPPQQHYAPPSRHPSAARSVAQNTRVKEEISLLDDETEERFGSMLAFIRPTHPLPNMKLNSPVNIYEHAMPGGPHRMRATTDNEEDIGLLNVEASHALCPLLAQQRINIESRVLKIDPVSSMLTIRINVYGSEQDKSEINNRIHQYCPLHYFDSRVADQFINSFARQQQQPIPASQQFNASAMQQVQPYISAAFSGPSISELEQHLDSVFSTEDQRKGYDIDISSLHMPHCIATELHEYQKQGLVWMQGRERLKAEWKAKKKEAGKRDPFTGQVMQDDEEVEQFLIWERRTKNGRVRYWNRAKNKFQASEPVFAKGGILADDMGLGKTLQMISLIASDMEGDDYEQSEEKSVKDEVDLLTDDIEDDDWLSKLDDDFKSDPAPPPSSRRHHVGPTLIVCPLSVITNWQEQIERHVKRMYRWRVYTYHGGQRVRDVGLLEQYDVVITTYNIVSSEWVDEEKMDKEEKEEKGSDGDGLMYGMPAPPRKKKDEEDESADHFPEDKPNSAAARSSPLFAMQWHRIILDEAHNIRERRTRQSRACRALLGICRWAVTGTPFQNRLDDGYALMHFLRIEPFTSHRWWNKLILEPIKRRDGRGIERLQQVMGSICLRRKKGDELNGKKILTLPDKHQRYLEVELTKEEKALYQVLEVSAHKRFVFLLNEDEALKQYAFVLEMLLRLRQCFAEDTELLTDRGFMSRTEVFASCPELAPSSPTAALASDDDAALPFGGALHAYTTSPMYWTPSAEEEKADAAVGIRHERLKGPMPTSAVQLRNPAGRYGRQCGLCGERVWCCTGRKAGTKLGKHFRSAHPAHIAAAAASRTAGVVSAFSAVSAAPPLTTPFSLSTLSAASTRRPSATASSLVSVTSEEDMNDDSCHACGEGGKLICCASCPSAWHLKCVGLKRVPKGVWCCAECTSQGDEEEKGDEDEDNDEPMMECDTPTLSTSSRRLRSSSASSPLPVAMEWKEEKEEKKDEVTRPVLMRPASMPLLQPTPPPSSASPLLFASLDPSTGHLVYLPATALVWKHVTSLVEFTHAAEAPNWAEDADEYGLTPDQVERMAARSARHASGERLKEEDKFRAERYSNGVSLLVSRQHDMYAQVGMAVSVNSHNTNWTGDYVKVKAGSLLADDVRQRVRMTGRATAGVDASADSDDQLPFIAALGLTTTAQIDDFLWLYGYWLGDGCLDVKSRGVDFCPKKQHDQEEVQKRLEALGFTVPSASVKVYNKADGRREFLVKDERWAGYFFAEYGPKYGVAAASSSRPHTHTGLITPLPKSVKWFWVWVWRLRKARARLMLAGLRYADGSEATGENNITTSNVHFRDEIIRLALHAGYAARFDVEYKGDDARGYNEDNNDITPQHDHWVVSYSDHLPAAEPVLYNHRDIHEVKAHAGAPVPVWSVTVPPHHLVIARRVRKNDSGVVTLASMPLVIGQCCDHISLVPDHYYRNGFGLSDTQLDETRRLLDLMASEASAQDKCRLCRQELGEDESDPWACVPCCVSVYHNSCLNRHFAESTALHAPNQSNIRMLAGQGKASCPSCQRTVKREQVVTSAMRSIVEAEDQRQEFNASALSASPASHMSSKMQVLLQELQSCISVGDKAVVFSQWTSFLDLLGPALTTAGIRFTRLDGAMSNQQRAAALTSFANNPSVSVFLISLKAGGVGLNLTAANRVYLMDIWWNPAAEDQAVDRVHRLGQTKSVDVVRMIVRGGVEERVKALQEKKREMTKNAMSRVGMSREETQAERLNDLRALFGVTETTPNRRG